MKVIVAHPFQQHSYKVAKALKSKGILYKYLTTVYLKKKSLTYLFSKVAKGENKTRVQQRKSKYIKDDEIVLIGELANLLLLLLYRIDKSKKMYYWWYWKTIDIFNGKLFRYIKKNKVDAIVVYDTVSYSFIKRVRKSKLTIKILLDMSAPNMAYSKYIFEKEANNNLYSSKDLNEINNDFFNKKCKAAEYEIRNVDGFLVASNFTKKSLQWNNIDNNKIFKCIYDVYNENGNYINKKDDKKIICVFSGKICLQKGAFRLFQAIDKVYNENLEFHFYGRYDKNSSYFDKYKEKCVFHDHIPHENMLKELEKSDVIVFPSFSDGFGLSVSEALSKNNIAICSNNSGISELIEDNKNGYTYDPDDTDRLVSILNGLTKENIKDMQIYASKSIKKYNEKYYEDSIYDAVKKICN